jgi:hypothetical protein
MRGQPLMPTTQHTGKKLLQEGKATVVKEGKATMLKVVQKIGFKSSVNPINRIWKNVFRRFRKDVTD